MKLTLAQLRKLPMPYSFREEMDLSEDLLGFEDICSVSSCQIKGKIKERGIETYAVEMEIHIQIGVKCAITLKEVPVHIETTAEELFSTDPSLEDAFAIHGQTLDTKEAVLMNILIAKPMKVVAEDATFEPEKEDSEQEQINPAFASLKHFL